MKEKKQMSEKIDVLDMIIHALTEHEMKISRAAELLDRVMGHTLTQEKLSKIEEYVEFTKAKYEEHQGLGKNVSPSDVLRDFSKILEAIRT